MSLKPKDLATTDYKIATRPTIGFELQTYVTAKDYTNLGTLQVVAPNSGVYTPNVADNAILGGSPQELMVVMDVAADLGATDLVVTVTGTDGSNNPLTGTATFTPPAVAQDQSHAFPRGFAAEVTTSPASGKFKTVTSVTVSTDAGITGQPSFLLIGFPSLDLNSFKLISTRTELNWDPASPMPTAIQDGKKKGAYIKPGTIDVGTFAITAKIPSEADGLKRYNGQRLCGWVVVKKESRLVCSHMFFCGLVIGATGKASEGEEPVTMDGSKSIYEVYAEIPAH